MQRNMFRGSLSIAALAMLVGCAGSPSASDGNTSSSSDALTRSIPQREWFAIDLSADGVAPAGGVSTKSLGLLDTPAAPAPVCDSSQNADFAALSAKISGDANGVLGNILGVVEAVTANPPVAHDDRHAVWGPITSPTAPSAYRLVLEKKDDKVTFLLAGRPKDGDDSSWKAVFAGTVAAPDDAHRAGDAHVDFDAMHALDPSSDPTAGGLNLHFEAEGPARAVDITFAGIAGKAAPTPGDAIYHFRGDAGGATFDFVTHSDFDGDGKADELVNVKSSFSRLGGQALITVTKDGAPKPIAATQCWNGGAKLVFYADDNGTRPPAGALECCPK